MSETPADTISALTRRLWGLEAIRVSVEEPFVLASGNRSPIYINCRQVISSPDFMRLYVQAATSALDGVEFDAIAGGATAGIPYAAYLASALNRPLLYVRKSVKGYGTGSQVEGTVEPGWKVLLVEDLITDGGSKLPFVDALIDARAEVSDALVLVDREQGGEELLASRGIHLTSLVSRTEALAIGVEDGLIDAQAVGEIEAYFSDTAGWHRQRNYDFTETS